MARILLVDDEECVRVAVCASLARMGHQVEAYDDSQPAIDQADFGRADLVIADLAMPTPGEMLVSVIRRRGYTMPTLVISGYIEDRERAALEALGGTKIIAKPYLPSELIALVGLLLGTACG